MRRWIQPLLRLLERTGRVFTYFNNHYAGCGPRSVEFFTRLFRERERLPSPRGPAADTMGGSSG